MLKGQELFLNSNFKRYWPERQRRLISQVGGGMNFGQIANYIGGKVIEILLLEA